MTANTPIRAATSGDLSNFRANNQGVKLGLTFITPATVYTARVNQTFATYDNIIEFEYDDGSGTLADVQAGMTCYIGSSAGARDKGEYRIRKSPTSTKIYIGATSALRIADDDYITIVDDFALWGREVSQGGGTTLIDSDIAFASRGAEAIIRAGGMVAVIKRVDGVATFTPPSPALSACYDGATIASWQYAATGAATTSNMTAGDGTASWTYTSAGRYRWTLTVTDSNGRTQTTHRWVLVDPTSAEFSLTTNPSTEDGGWMFGATMYADATTSDIKDRALCVLYADAEYYNGAAATIGKLAGYENIIAVGWVDAETIVKDSQAGTVEFSVYGAAHWLGKVNVNALGLENTSSTPTKWTQVEDMTADRALARLLLWTSTAPLIIDCFFSGSTTPLDIVVAPAGSLRGAIEAAAVNTVFARLGVNTLGQMYIDIDPQMMTSAQRAALTTVIDITEADYEDAPDIERLTSGSASMIELSCNIYSTRVSTVYSRAPGNIGAPFGEDDAPSNYYADDQTDCNRLAGCLYAMANPQYSPLTLTLAQNRLIDIAPAQLCEITLTDSVRGISLTDQKLIPRNVTLEFDDGGFYKTVVEFELLIAGVDGVAYFPPRPVNRNDVSFDPSEFCGLGDFPLGDFPLDDLSFPLTTPPILDACKGVNLAPPNQYALQWSPSLIESTGTRVASCYFPCAIRAGDNLFPTKIEVYGVFQNCKDVITLYGVSGGSRVLTATGSATQRVQMGITFEFSPASATDIDGFELEVAEGGGWEAGAVLATGTVQANNSAGATISSLSVGSYYAIEGSGGPCNIEPGWYLEPGTYWIEAYDTSRKTRAIGYRAGISPNVAELGTMGVFGEAVNTYHSRVYFSALYTSIKVRVYDYDNPSYYADNSGSLGYILREATNNNATANLNQSVLSNVCAR